MDSVIARAEAGGAKLPESDPADVALMQATVRTIKLGETRVIPIRHGYSISMTKTPMGITAAVAAPSSDKDKVTIQASPCAWAVASAIVAIGAAGIGVLMAATAGAGGAVIAGIFVSSNTLGGIAAGGWGFSAILGLVALYVC